MTIVGKLLEDNGGAIYKVLIMPTPRPWVRRAEWRHVLKKVLGLQLNIDSNRAVMGHRGLYKK